MRSLWRPGARSGSMQITPQAMNSRPLPSNVHGAYGSGWLDLLQRLARQAIERQPGPQGGLPGFNAAGSLAQIFRMRLSVPLQTSSLWASSSLFQISLAHAVHSRAGRAIVAALGSRLPASFPASSYSNLMLLTRGSSFLWASSSPLFYGRALSSLWASTFFFFLTAIAVDCLRSSLARRPSFGGRALHLRAGRALAAASGSGQGTHFNEPSLSDLRLLSRGY
eukprot:SM000051S17582  [mRNA]  locus=s51:543531:544327:+ [translate_table: standard]